MSKLFHSTIEEISKRIKLMENEFQEELIREIESKTGGDNWHNPNKQLKEAKQITLDELRETYATSQPLSKPQDNKSVHVGHKVTLQTDQETSLILHICSETDTEILGSKINTTQERMLSIDSTLGKKINKKKIGDIIEVNSKKFKIIKIETSELA
ncbi:GreA/GreB family elongation factor [Candidatus Dojkabacteria bacterium]|nr:GreA/GreB family elongation factor [Candidatus Dojkabacteria bacterium]